MSDDPQWPRWYLLDVASTDPDVRPAPLWWLSFCDADRPKGAQFLGACIVPGIDMISAVKEAHRLGCNPGGAVKGFQIPEERRELAHAEDIGVLMSREECKRFDARVQ